jgi:hypothetical protein
MLGTIFELGSCKLRPRGTTRPRFGGWLADSAIGSSAPHDPVASSQRSEIRTSQTMLRRACAKRSSKHRWTSSSRSRTRTSRRILAGLEVHHGRHVFCCGFRDFGRLLPEICPVANGVVCAPTKWHGIYGQPLNGIRQLFCAT